MALTNDTNPGPAVAQTQNFVLGGSPILVGTAPTSLVGFYGTLPGVQQPVVSTLSGWLTATGAATSTAVSAALTAYNSTWALQLSNALLSLGIIAG